MSPLSRTSWTRKLPKPVDVPVMKKTRGIMTDGTNRFARTLLEIQHAGFIHWEKRHGDKESGEFGILCASSIRMSELFIGVIRRI
jgi:hypothetical protein